MKKSLSSKGYQSNGAKTAERLDRKKLFAIALSTFLILVVVSEGIRLAAVFVFIEHVFSLSNFRCNASLKHCFLFFSVIGNLCRNT